MNEFLEFLTSSEIMIVGVIAVLGGFLGLMLFIFEKTSYRRKQRHNTRELNDLVGDVKMDKVESIESTVEPLYTEKKEEEIKPVYIESSDNIVSINDEQIIESKIIPIEDTFNVEDALEETEILEIEDSISNNTLEEQIENIEEKPLVIPIEEFESRKSIEDIYSEVKEKVESIEDITNNSIEENLIYTDIEPNKEEAIEELKKATENLIKNAENKNSDSNNIELTRFEAEQEENAIISMDELMKKSNELYEKNEVTQYADEGNEPISLQDLELRMNNIKNEISAIEENNKIVNDNIDTIVESPYEDISKVRVDNSNKIYRDDIVFKSSPIISPIFGIENTTSSNDIMLENTANYDKFDEEIKKTNEFIVTLKELQEKLD